MSKQRVVERVEQNGIGYGQISRPLDFVKSQEYAHAHVERVTQDFLTQAEAEVAGCNILLSTGLNFNVAVGRIYRAGLQYESEIQNLSLAPAHEEFERIDLVVAVVTDNAPANTEFLAFQRLRTEQELNSNAAAYPPTQFQRATERHNVAAITVKTGDPSESGLPQAPATAANEVPLYEIRVSVNAANLQLSNVADVRRTTSNLRTVNSQVISHSESLALHAEQIAELYEYELLQRDFSLVFGEPGTKSLLEILRIIATKLLVLKYRYPTAGTGDTRCPASVRQLNGQFVIDIPSGVFIEFGDKYETIKPENFPLSVNARFTNGSNPTPPENGSPGNVITFDAPATTKTLYLGYAGNMFFLDTPEPSQIGQCVLLKIIRNGSGAPTLKTYRNQRLGLTTYSKTYIAGDNTSKQFELDIGAPLGTYSVDAYGVKISDKTRYQITTSNFVFDGIIDVNGVTAGDTWYVHCTSLNPL